MTYFKIFFKKQEKLQEKILQPICGKFATRLSSLLTVPDQAITENDKTAFLAGIGVLESGWNVTPMKEVDAATNETKICLMATRGAETIEVNCSVKPDGSPPVMVLSNFTLEYEGNDDSVLNSLLAFQLKKHSKWHGIYFDDRNKLLKINWEQPGYDVRVLARSPHFLALIKKLSYTLPRCSSRVCADLIRLLSAHKLRVLDALEEKFTDAAIADLSRTLDDAYRFLEKLERRFSRENAITVFENTLCFSQKPWDFVAHMELYPCLADAYLDQYPGCIWGWFFNLLVTLSPILPQCTKEIRDQLFEVLPYCHWEALRKVDQWLRSIISDDLDAAKEEFEKMVIASDATMKNLVMVDKSGSGVLFADITHNITCFSDFEQCVRVTAILPGIYKNCLAPIEAEDRAVFRSNEEPFPKTSFLTALIGLLWKYPGLIEIMPTLFSKRNPKVLRRLFNFIMNSPVALDADVFREIDRVLKALQDKFGKEAADIIFGSVVMSNGLSDIACRSDEILGRANWLSVPPNFSQLMNKVKDVVLVCELWYLGYLLEFAAHCGDDVLKQFINIHNLEKPSVFKSAIEEGGEAFAALYKHFGERAAQILFEYKMSQSHGSGDFSSYATWGHQLMDVWSKEPKPSLGLAQVMDELKIELFGCRADIFRDLLGLLSYFSEDLLQRFAKNFSSDVTLRGVQPFTERSGEDEKVTAFQQAIVNAYGILRQFDQFFGATVTKILLEKKIVHCNYSLDFVQDLRAWGDRLTVKKGEGVERVQEFAPLIEKLQGILPQCSRDDTSEKLVEVLWYCDRDNLTQLESQFNIGNANDLEVVINHAWHVLRGLIATFGVSDARDLFRNIIHNSENSWDFEGYRYVAASVQAIYNVLQEKQCRDVLPFIKKLSGFLSSCSKEVMDELLTIINSFSQKVLARLVGNFPLQSSAELMQAICAVPVTLKLLGEVFSENAQTVLEDMVLTLKNPWDFVRCGVVSDNLNVIHRLVQEKCDIHEGQSFMWKLSVVLLQCSSDIGKKLMRLLRFFNHDIFEILILKFNFIDPAVFERAISAGIEVFNDLIKVFEKEKATVLFANIARNLQNPWDFARYQEISNVLIDIYSHACHMEMGAQFLPLIEKLSEILADPSFAVSPKKLIAILLYCSDENLQQLLSKFGFGDVDIFRQAIIKAVNVYDEVVLSEDKAFVKAQEKLTSKMEKVGKDAPQLIMDTDPEQGFGVPEKLDATPVSKAKRVYEAAKIGALKRGEADTDKAVLRALSGGGSGESPKRCQDAISALLDFSVPAATSDASSGDTHRKPLSSDTNRPTSR